MAARGRILIADSDASVRAECASSLQDLGFAVTSATDPFKALHKIAAFLPDVVLADDAMLGMDCVELMRKVRLIRAGTQVAVMTADASIERAVRAVRQGAVDYLVKPLDPERLRNALDRAVRRARMTRHAQPAPSLHGRFPGIVSGHPAMVALLHLIEQIAPSRASVLLEGESGTGKGLIAEAIHKASLRASGPFVRLSCAELSPSLLESEVFGHERGAFTGAMTRREGRFEQADGGTLFLDEVGEIPLSTQVKLLRFMQERTFERVGGNETLRVDVRVISASNRPLQACVDEGRFRLDLFFRLNVVPLRIPPLRERASDIPRLVGHFLQRFARENGRRVDDVSDEVIALLAQYPWPGNVRELENVIERAVVLCQGQRIESQDLPSHMAPHAGRDDVPRVPGATVYEVERWAILRTLEAHGGATAQAATVLGISPRKIQYKLHQYDELDRALHERHHVAPDDSASTNGRMLPIEGDES